MLKLATYTARPSSAALQTLNPGYPACRPAGRRPTQRSGNLSSKPSGRTSRVVSRKLSATAAVAGAAAGTKQVPLPDRLSGTHAVGNLGAAARGALEALESAGLSGKGGAGSVRTAVGVLSKGLESIGSVGTAGGSEAPYTTLQSGDINGIPGFSLQGTRGGSGGGAGGGATRAAPVVFGAAPAACRVQAYGLPGPSGNGSSGDGSSSGSGGQKGMFKRMTTALLQATSLMRSATHLSTHAGPGMCRTVWACAAAQLPLVQPQQGGHLTSAPAPHGPFSSCACQWDTVPSRHSGRSLMAHAVLVKR